MSKLSMVVEIDFMGGLKDRDTFCVEIEMHKKNPTNEEIADVLREELLNYLNEGEE